MGMGMNMRKITEELLLICMELNNDFHVRIHEDKHLYPLLKKSLGVSNLTSKNKIISFMESESYDIVLKDRLDYLLKYLPLSELKLIIELLRMNDIIIYDINNTKISSLPINDSINFILTRYVNINTIMITLDSFNLLYSIIDSNSEEIFYEIIIPVFYKDIKVFNEYIDIDNFIYEMFDHLFHIVEITAGTTNNIAKPLKFKIKYISEIKMRLSLPFRLFRSTTKFLELYERYEELIMSIFSTKGLILHISNNNFSDIDIATLKLYNVKFNIN
jgi:hypothetical protein